MVPLHVRELDREHVRRALQLRTRDQQRRRMALLRPPLDRRRECQQLRKYRVLQYTKQVYVGVLGIVLARNRRAVENQALEIRLRSLPKACDELADLFFWNQVFRSHDIPQSIPLPPPARSPTARAAPAESTEPSSVPAESATAPSSPAIAPTATPAQQEHVEEQPAQRRHGQHDDKDHEEGEDPTRRDARVGTRRRADGRDPTRLRGCDLNAGVFRDHVDHARSQQTDGAVVVPALQVRHGFASEPANLTVWENRFQAVADVDVVTAVLYGKKDQDTAVFPFLPDAPTLIEIHRVVENLGAVGGLDRNHYDRCLCLVEDLAAHLLQLRDGGWTQYSGKVVDAIGGLQGRDGLRGRQRAPCNHGQNHAQTFQRPSHRRDCTGTANPASSREERAASNRSMRLGYSPLGARYSVLATRHSLASEPAQKFHNLLFGPPPVVTVSLGKK